MASLTSPLSAVESARKEIDKLSQTFAEADIKGDGKLSKNEFKTFVVAQGGLGLNKTDQNRLYNLLEERNALDDCSSFLATAVATSELGSSHQVEMYVPSTADVSRVINEEELRQRVDQTAVFFTEVFYGASVASATLGYYKSDDGAIVKEKTHKIYSFTTLSILQRSTDDVLQFAQEKCEEWTQECIAVVIDGTMHFVYPANVDESIVHTDEKLLQMFFSRVKRRADVDTIASRVKRAPRTPSPSKKQASTV